MKTRELRKPLIQSAIVLVVIVFLISMVGGSESTSFLGMISSIIMGIIKTVWFIIILPIAIIVGIACLIGVYFAAVALYSMEDAKKLWGQLLESIARVRADYTGCNYTPGVYATPDAATDPVELEAKDTTGSADTAAPAKEEAPPAVVPTSTVAPEELESLKSQLDDGLTEIHSILKEIRSKESDIEESIADLNNKLGEKAGADISETVTKIAGAHEEVTNVIAKKGERLDTIEASLSKHTATAADLVNKIAELQKSLSEANTEINQLQEMVTTPTEDESDQEGTSAPLSDHRIFSYIESEEDRAFLTGKIDEAVKKDMTYAEIDTFLTETLSKEMDEIIKDHPSLTKDFIREYKKRV